MSDIPFLTAQWRNLLNITYSIPPSVLLPYLPDGVELDIQNGNAFVSFVAFDFLDTRLKGLPIPFHVNFPEINLRFYVKYGNERAVCFIREFVPKVCIALVANRLYNEPYRAIPMQTKTLVDADKQQINVTHRFKVKGNWYSAQVQAHLQSYTPPDNSIAHYFKEHDLGFGVDKQGNTLSYRVIHPVWAIYPIQHYDLQVNFGQIYGQSWAFLNELKPISVLLAQGSDIAVYAPTKVENKK